MLEVLTLTFRGLAADRVAFPCHTCPFKGAPTEADALLRISVHCASR